MHEIKNKSKQPPQRFITVSFLESHISNQSAIFPPTFRVILYLFDIKFEKSYLEIENRENYFYFIFLESESSSAFYQFPYNY